MRERKCKGREDKDEIIVYTNISISSLCQITFIKLTRLHFKQGHFWTCFRREGCLENAEQLLGFFVSVSLVHFST